MRCGIGSVLKCSQDILSSHGHGIKELLVVIIAQPNLGCARIFNATVIAVKKISEQPLSSAVGEGWIEGVRAAIGGEV